MNKPKQKLIAFLTFTGVAEEAMNFYENILPNTKIESLVRFEPGQPNGDPGKVLNGVLDISGQKLMFMDMQKQYPAPPHSWSLSLFIPCETETEFDRIFSGLSREGVVMMGPEPVMTMRKCAWVTDRFGVTWQLVWE